MSDDRTPPSLDDFDARMQKARSRGDGTDGKPQGRTDQLPQNAMGLAFRIGIELVVAMGVGVGLGHLLDSWLGIAPWGLVVMFFLGAGAGMVNVYRAVNGLGYATGYRRTGDTGAPRDGGEPH